MLVVTRAADVTAILEDPSYVVPPVPPGGPPGTVAWLRAHVCRFSSGTEHRRRRALVTAELARIAPGRPLAAALGVPGAGASVAAVAQAYQPGTGDEAAADRAVAALLRALGAPPDETTAARICLLAQAHDPVAKLAAAARADVPLDTILRDDPPVRTTRRVGPDGVPVLLDLAAAHLPFGAGAHECPGRAHALALAR